MQKLLLLFLKNKRRGRLKGLTWRLFLFLSLAPRRTPKEEMEGQEEDGRGGGEGGAGAK